MLSKYLPIVKKCPLFAGIGETNIEQILPCLSASVRQSDKNAFILSAGDSVSFVGLILSGSVHIVSEDFWGRKDILSQVHRTKRPVVLTVNGKADAVLMDA